MSNELREDLRNRLRELGYQARIVNRDCFDIDQNGVTHYLTTDEATELLHAGAGIDLMKHSEKCGRNRWYTFPAKGRSAMTPEDKPAPYSKQFPEVSGWYWMRGFRQYRTLPVEVSGNKFAMMYGNGVLFDAADAEGAEFAGPISPSDAEQLIELRRLGAAMLEFLNDDEPTLLQADSLAKGLRAVLNPSHSQEKETR